MRSVDVLNEHSISDDLRSEETALIHCVCVSDLSLTITLGQVRRRVQMRSTHVVPMSLRSNPSLLDPLFARRATGHGPINGRHHWRVLIHHAAQWTPWWAGVLWCWSGREQRAHIHVSEGCILLCLSFSACKCQFHKHYINDRVLSCRKLDRYLMAKTSTMPLLSLTKSAWPKRKQ